MADVLPATEKVFMDLELMLNSTRQVVAYLTRDSPGPGQQEFHVLCLDERGCLLHHCRLPDPGDFETSYRNLLSAALAVKGTKAARTTSSSGQRASGRTRRGARTGTTARTGRQARWSCPRRPPTEERIRREMERPAG